MTRECTLLYYSDRKIDDESSREKGKRKLHNVR